MAIPESEPLKFQEPVKKKKTFRERIAQIKENITVEPVLTCFVVPGNLVRLATQNLNLEKACRVNLNIEDSVCDAVIARKGDYLDEELAVQKLIASMEIWKHVVSTAIPAFLIMFLGAWSDRTGKRKVCILLPIIGDILMLLSNILNTYFFRELPVEVVMFFEAFFPAITGGWIATYMGAFSYISDVSSEENRTFRVGVASLCLTAGAPIGSALSGILLNAVGYYGVFSISLCLYLSSFLYGVFYIRDPERAVTKQNKEVQKSFCKSFFDLNHVKDTFKIGFKRGPNQRLTKSILIFLAIIIIHGPHHGEGTLRYLFARRRFNWDALLYSFFSTFSICTHGLGALISISLFSRRWKWDDSVLGIISNMSHAAGALAVGLSRTSFHMYLAVVVETFNATSITALRSITSKLVSSDELGKMFSLFNLIEIVTSMLFSPVYSMLYMATVSYDAGIIYYLSAVLAFPAVSIFVWFYIQQKNKPADDLKIDIEIELENNEKKVVSNT